jgi:hypothetical protein
MDSMSIQDMQWKILSTLYVELGNRISLDNVQCSRTEIQIRFSHEDTVYRIKFIKKDRLTLEFTQQQIGRRNIIRKQILSIRKAELSQPNFMKALTDSWFNFYNDTTWAG